MKKKTSIILFLSFLLIVANLSPSVSMAAPVDFDSKEYAIIDGEKTFAEKEVKNGVTRTIIKNEKGQVLADVSIDLNNKEAFVDGVKLSDEEFNDFETISQELINEGYYNQSLTLQSTSPDSYQINSASACSYKKMGSTKYKTTWKPVAGTAVLAAWLLTRFPGMKYGSAIAIAGALAGSANTLYYTVEEYSCSKGGVYYLRTTRKFYKHYNYTGYIGQFSVYGSRR